MGYEVVRPYARKGSSVGGHYVRGYHRFTDRRGPRPRRRNMNFPGRRSASPAPILWVGALLAGGVMLFLVVFTLTHLTTPATTDPAPALHPTTSPALVTTPARSCYPFQPSCH